MTKQKIWNPAMAGFVEVNDSPQLIAATAAALMPSVQTTLSEGAKVSYQLPPDYSQTLYGIVTRVDGTTYAVARHRIDDGGNAKPTGITDIVPKQTATQLETFPSNAELLNRGVAALFAR